MDPTNPDRSTPTSEAAGDGSDRTPRRGDGEAEPGGPNPHPATHHGTVDHTAGAGGEGAAFSALALSLSELWRWVRRRRATRQPDGYRKNEHQAE